MKFFVFLSVFFLSSCSFFYNQRDDAFALSYSICNRLGFNTISTNEVTPIEAFDYCTSEVQKAILLYRIEND